MSPEVWLEYAVYVFLFMVTPGPSHLLMISNSLGSGFDRSYACAIGDLSANTLQILIAGFGLGLIAQYGSVLLAVKVLGLVYLFYSGARMLYDGAQTRARAAEKKSVSALYLQGFLTSIINPKAVIFFAALFPQFLIPEQPIAVQLLVLGATYIAIDGAFLMFYGLSASAVARKLGEHSRIVRYVPGCIMIATVVILSLRVIAVETSLL